MPRHTFKILVVVNALTWIAVIAATHYLLQDAGAALSDLSHIEIVGWLVMQGLLVWVWRKSR